MIPSGQRSPCLRHAGVIAQSLGIPTPCTTIHGYMIRVDAKDADALGLAAAPAAAEPEAPPATAAEMEEKM